MQQNNLPRLLYALHALLLLLLIYRIVHLVAALAVINKMKCTQSGQTTCNENICTTSCHRMRCPRPLALSLSHSINCCSCFAAASIEHVAYNMRATCYLLFTVSCRYMLYATVRFCATICCCCCCCQTAVTDAIFCATLVVLLVV